MSQAKLERAAHKLTENIRYRIRDNLTQAAKAGQLKLDPATLTRALSLISASIDEGYVLGAQHLDDVLQLVSDSAQDVVSFPDALIDIVPRFVRMARNEPLAAFTIVRNEAFFLPLWCSYYGRAVGEDNLYVLDNSSDDGSIAAAKTRFPKINVVSVPSRDSQNWAWCTNVVKCFQRIALRGYQAVIFADADEFLVPTTCDLNSYCKAFLAGSQDYVRAQGWGIIQDLGESTLTDQTDVLADRHMAWRCQGYDKILLSKIPLNWAKGSHTIYLNSKKASNLPVDDRLALLHLRDLDMQQFWSQCQAKRKLTAQRSSAFQSASNFEQVMTYFRTRRPPWYPDANDYSDQSCQVLDNWRKQLRMQ